MKVEDNLPKIITTSEAACSLEYSNGKLSGINNIKFRKIIDIVDKHFSQFNNEEYMALWISEGSTEYVMSTPVISEMVLVVFADIYKSLDSHSMSEDLDEELSEKTGIKIRTVFIDNENYNESAGSHLQGIPLVVKNSDEYKKFIDRHNSLREINGYDKC